MLKCLALCFRLCLASMSRLHKSLIYKSIPSGLTFQLRKSNSFLVHDLHLETILGLPFNLKVQPKHHISWRSTACISKVGSPTLHLIIWCQMSWLHKSPPSAKCPAFPHLQNENDPTFQFQHQRDLRSRS